MSDIEEISDDENEGPPFLIHKNAAVESNDSEEVEEDEASEERNIDVHLVPHVVRGKRNGMNFPITILSRYLQRMKQRIW